MEKLKDNFDWFYSNYEKLRREFSNQYVAVKGRKHIDNDHNLEKLLKRLEIKTLDDSILVEFVNK
ncbi:MAG TPA: DUF5678 domain-containing protein [Candidatus Nitrosocosmicus sp.]|nr:DUF5678 domain-containing protein [Candidatus Nitrosocosmicus sp.]